MSYILQFLIGGTIMVLASLLSKSKYLFLSGVITLLPIMTLINIGLQMKNMSLTNFRITQKNAIYGAMGAVILIGGIYILSNWFKPLYATLIAFACYIVYMVCVYFISNSENINFSMIHKATKHFYNL